MNASEQRRVGLVDARIWIALALTFGGLRCSNGGGHAAADAAIASGGNGSPDAAVGAAPTDAARSVDAGGNVMCAAHATVSDPCKTLSIGTVSACGSGDGGQPSQTGYLEIVAPDGSQRYTCATSWTEGGSGGYTFGQPDQFMSDPKSCCGGSATPVAGPTAPPPTSGGFFGAPHPPTHIKPQESAQPGAGQLRQNPFAVAVSDSAGAAAFSSALAMWQKWAGDGVAMLRQMAVEAITSPPAFSLTLPSSRPAMVCPLSSSVPRSPSPPTGRRPSVTRRSASVPEAVAHRSS